MPVKKEGFDIVEYEYRKGLTLNIGDFEGIRFDIGMKVSTSKQQLETTRAVVQGMVHDDLDVAATEVMKSINLADRSGQLAKFYKAKGNEDSGSV